MMEKIKKLIVKGFYQVSDESLTVAIDGFGGGVQMYDRQGLEYLVVSGHALADQIRPILSKLKSIDFRYAGELSD